MTRPPWCPLGKVGDHVLGEASSPGSNDLYCSDPAATKEFHVLPGQQICPGDILTVLGQRVFRVESAAASGDGMNWGNVSSGAYMALTPADTTSTHGRRGSNVVRVTGALATSILDDGASWGCCMGVDLRAVVGNKRVARKRPVTCSTDHGLDRELWQRTRVMSEEDMCDSVRRKAFLGRLVEILSANGLNHARQAQGHYGRIEIQSQNHAAGKVAHSCTS